MKDDILDVLILGGGFSGLAAARELTKLGLRYRVVDAYTDHLGGRAYSYAVSPTLGYDHGAEYIGDLQTGIMNEIRALLPAGDLVNGVELRTSAPQEVMYLAEHRFCFNKADAALGIQGIPPDIGLPALLGIIGLLAEMTLIEIGIDVVEPWKSPAVALELDKVSIDDWVKTKWWVNERARDVLRISVEAVLSVEPAQISPFYLLWYTACNDGLLNEVNDDAGGPQQYWLRRGMSSLAEKIAEPFRDHIDQGVRVTRVDHAGATVKIETDGGKTYEAKRLLVSVSPHSAGRITWSPEPPPDRRALFELPMGKTIKCQVFYESRWWYASKGFKYDGYVGGSDYPICWVMDNSPPDADAASGPFVLMTFTVGAQVDALGPNPTDAQIEKTVLDALVFLFDDERARDHQRFVIHRWVPSDPFVGGGPNTVFTPGLLSGGPGKLLNEPWGDNIYFASSENARNLDPTSKSPSWDLLATEKLPKYDANGVLLPDPAPPFTSRYSDMRRSLGYMDGGLASGQYGAHVVAASLGAPGAAVVTSPAAAAERAPFAIPEPAPLSLAEAAHVLAEVLQDPKLHEATAGAGLQGATSRLRDALVRALARAGRIPEGTTPDHPAAHVAVRDFAIAFASHTTREIDAAEKAAHEAATKIHAHVAALETKLKALFSR